MCRREVLDEWFYASEVRGPDGHIYPAPKKAVDQYLRLKNHWLAPHPKLPLEEPRVSLGPGVNKGILGYFVRTEIICRPQPSF